MEHEVWDSHCRPAEGPLGFRCPCPGPCSISELLLPQAQLRALGVA